MTGVLIALAMAVASETMSAEKRGTAISIVFMGFTIASVVGVPLDTIIGQWGGWQLAFWFTALLGIISLLTSAATIPKGLKGLQSSLKKQLDLLTNSRIIIAFSIPALSIGAIYTVYTYLTPLMQEVLFVTFNSIATGLISISFIALIVYIMNSTMQIYFIDLADKYFPTAKDLASSLTPDP